MTQHFLKSLCLHYNRLAACAMAHMNWKLHFGGLLKFWTVDCACSLFTKKSLERVWAHSSIGCSRNQQFVSDCIHSMRYISYQSGDTDWKKDLGPGLPTDNQPDYCTLATHSPAPATYTFSSSIPAPATSSQAPAIPPAPATPFFSSSNSSSFQLLPIVYSTLAWVRSNFTLSSP